MQKKIRKRSVVNKNSAANDFFEKRRSVSARLLKGPGPEVGEVNEIMTCAFRVPDHGKLEPWRVVLFRDQTKRKFQDLVEKRALEIQLDPIKLKKTQANLTNAPLIIIVLGSPVESSRIPEIEQTLSVGALCLNILNNFLARGWGANWLTGWMAYDRILGTQAFDLGEREFTAGLIYVGQYDEDVPDRTRPTLDSKIAWL